jgi:hypothetical protein
MGIGPAGKWVETQMTKSKALALAAKQVGQVFRCVPGLTGFGYSSWSPRHNAWWAATPIGTYNAARAYRSASLYETALKIAFPNADDFDVAINPGGNRSAKEQFDRAWAVMSEDVPS